MEFSTVLRFLGVMNLILILSHLLNIFKGKNYMYILYGLIKKQTNKQLKVHKL